MDPPTLRAAVELRDANSHDGGKPTLEASGGVNLETVRAAAETGVDFISVGALTHSAPVLDFSLLLSAD
jgi:nicotinate-nucleotide pyrophosphorylase (carboxylating)